VVRRPRILRADGGAQAPLGAWNVGEGAAAASPKKAPKKKLEDVYKKMTQREHILTRPDTYVGSIETTTERMLVYSDAGGFQTREITFVPGLYKVRTLKGRGRGAACMRQ